MWQQSMENREKAGHVDITLNNSVTFVPLFPLLPVFACLFTFDVHCCLSLRA